MSAQPIPFIVSKHVPDDDLVMCVLEKRSQELVVMVLPATMEKVGIQLVNGEAQEVGLFKASKSNELKPAQGGHGGNSVRARAIVLRAEPTYKKAQKLAKALILDPNIHRIDINANPASTPVLASAVGVIQSALMKVFNKQRVAAVQIVKDTLAVRKVAKARRLMGRLDYQGLSISIENAKGSVRSGVSPDGTPWSVTMPYPYGYIRMTMGVDGDHVDCFIGPNPNAENAYVVHTNNPHGGIVSKYDEDKVMLGWDSPEDALSAFLESYSSTAFFRNIETIPMDKFKELVLATKDRPATVTIGKLAKADDADKDSIIQRITNLTDAEFTTLPEEVQQALVDSALSGVDRGLGQLQVNDADLSNRVNLEAAKWARNRAAEMVGKKWVNGVLVDNLNAQWAITDTTRDNIRALVTQAFEPDADGSPIGVDTLADQIQGATSFSAARANNIAATEVKNAAIEGNWGVWEKGNLVAEVKWLNSNDPNVCDICIGFARNSPYPIDRAPRPVRDSHPHCDCSVVATKLKPKQVAQHAQALTQEEQEERDLKEEEKEAGYEGDRAQGEYDPGFFTGNEEDQSQND